MDALSIPPTEQIMAGLSGSRQVVTLRDPAIHTRSENNGVTAESGCFQTFLLFLTSHTLQEEHE